MDSGPARTIPIQSDRATGLHRPISGAVLLLMLLIVLAVFYVSFSDGVSYVHVLGKACLVAHDGWHFHLTCDSVDPSSIPTGTTGA